MARLVRGYLLATAFIVAVVTLLTFFSSESTAMSPAARLVGAGFLLSLQITGARLDWARRLEHGRGQLGIDAIVLGLILVNTIQPMVSGPDMMTAWGIVVTVVFGGVVASQAAMGVGLGIVAATSSLAIVRFADVVDPVLPITSAVLTVLLGWLSSFAGQSFRQSMRDSHGAAQHAAAQRAQASHAQERTIVTLRRLDRMKDDFISTVSHELRTPLTVILGLSSTLVERGRELEPEQHQDLLVRLQANAEDLHTVITRLLDFEKLSRSDLEATGSTCSLHDAVSLALALVDVDEELLEISLDPVPEVLGDEVLLARVICELMTNAVRHNPAGTDVAVRVRLEREGARLIVEDHGDGLQSDHLAELINRFGRGGRYETRPTRGLGLGLSFCHEVLQRHGSTLEVHPTKHGGTSFSFLLPPAAALGASSAVGNLEARASASDNTRTDVT